MFHTLHNTIEVEIIDIAYSDMKVQTKNTANHKKTLHQRVWLMFLLKALKGSLHYYDISHLGPSALFKGTYFSAKQCLNLWRVSFLKHANALFSTKALPEIRITVLLTRIHHSCWLGNVGAKVCFQQKTGNTVSVCGQCTSLTAELTLTGWRCFIQQCLR